jgi:hypothetical protein
MTNHDVNVVNDQLEKMRGLLRIEREEIEQQEQRLVDFENSTREIWVKRNTDFLSTLGMDQEALEKQTQRDKEYLLKQLDRFNEIEQEKAYRRSLPQRALESAIRTRPSPNRRISSAPAQPQIIAQLTPPAVGSDPPEAEGVSCFPETGEIRFHRRASGGGGAWGWFASVATRAGTLELYFVYIPAFDGTLLATANVHLQGNAWIIANHPFWTNTSGTIEMFLYCNIFQDPSQGIYRGQPVHIIDESRTGGVYHRVFDDEPYYPSCSAAYIFARQPVLINVGVGLKVDGHSDYGIADVDFNTQLPGINNRISIPSIEVSQDPFIIL